MKEKIATWIYSCALAGGIPIEQDDVVLERPQLFSHGDYATNIALQMAKKMGKNPRACAEEIVATMTPLLDDVARIEVAGPGFINVTLTPKYYAQTVTRLAENNIAFGELFADKQIMVEYTDPNPFKVFHIGHLMTNIIGEAWARVCEAQGAQVIRANYQGDVGLHVAKAIWAMRKHAEEMPGEDAPLSEKTAFLGRMYAFGGNAYEQGGEEKEQIDALNKDIYELTDLDIKQLYDVGRAWSLAHFEELYALLGTAFNEYYFERDVADRGLVTVREHTDIYVESQGAVIFKGEEHGLHTRVFVNKNGLPTYEAKELGLALTKFEDYPNLDASYVVTADEQADYMRVVLASVGQFRPDITEKTHHIPHGMMLGPDGKKMSSRTGDVITGEGLLQELQAEARARIDTGRVAPEDVDALSDNVAVGAIKYMVLRQDNRKNIIFDREKALSTEGDSGPYLMYTHARLCSLVDEGSAYADGMTDDENREILDIERMLARFEETVDRAGREIQPHSVMHYVMELARSFNSWYGSTQIIVTDDAVGTAHRMMIVRATKHVLARGLDIMGIQAPERM